MARFINDSYLNSFAKTLNKEITKYRKPKANRDEMFEQQKVQLQDLYDLENEFTDRLKKDKHGDEAMLRFCEFILNIKRNTLSARPYFRERSKLMSDIGPAIKNRDLAVIYKYHMNYNLIKFLVLNCELKDPELKNIYIEAGRLRNEIAICNFPLAINRAKIFFSRTPQSHLDYLDLIQIAAAGLFNAIDKYVPPFTHSFKSVIIGRIVGELIESYSIEANTILNPHGQPPKTIGEFKSGDQILGVDDNGEIIVTDVIKVHDHGTLEGFEVTFDDGYKIVCSENHKFLTKDGMCAIKDIVNQNKEILYGTPEQTGRMADVLRPKLSIQTETNRSHQDLSRMSTTSFGEETEFCQGRRGGESFGSWLAQSLWDPFYQTSAIVGSSTDMRYVSENDYRQPSRELRKMASGEPREGSSEYGSCQQGILSKSQSRSGQEGAVPSKSSQCYDSVAQGSSGGVSKEYQKSLERPEAIKNGSMATEQRNVNMERRANLLWGRSQTSGFRISGSQDMDRGRWKFSFFRSGKTQGSRVAQNSSSGRNVEKRSFEQGRCNADSVGDDVFYVQHGSNETRMEGMPFGYAPLASTGNLSTRRVIQYRSVGPRPMLDLEVSHPKHNFLLPNGVVTSNSETMLHFFPYDKKKLYNANKIAHRFREKEVDYEALTEELNKTGILPEKVTVHEISDLLMAASHVSSDLPKKANNPTLLSGEPENLSVDRFPDNNQTDPEMTLIEDNTRKALYSALGGLSVLESKIIRIKGGLDV